MHRRCRRRPDVGSWIGLEAYVVTISIGISFNANFGNKKLGKSDRPSVHQAPLFSVKPGVAIGFDPNESTRADEIVSKKIARPLPEWPARSV